jgi:CDP-paratose 2-epimerase
MRVVITGICGFVGSELALWFREQSADNEVVGIDNLIRPGSESNRPRLHAAGVRVVHGDVRCASDFESLPPADWVIDAAANPSVLAGVDGKTSGRQLVEHNLGGTCNILEYCRRHGAGFVLLSTSRVYSIAELARVPMTVVDEAFVPDAREPLPAGCSVAGLTEDFSTRAPLSLYGATKLASEVLALEYGGVFGFPVWVNRCGVMAGAGQFGTAEQGVFSYWVRAYAAREPLRYIGFDGLGHQSRDALHPRDLADLVARQMRTADNPRRIYNVGGGAANVRSLAQLTRWCARRFGPHRVGADPRPRPFDVPWVAMDSRAARDAFDWEPRVSIEEIVDEVARPLSRADGGDVDAATPATRFAP